MVFESNLSGIDIFYHVYKYGPAWRDLVQEQLTRVRRSGLMGDARVFLHTTGNGSPLVLQDFPEVIVQEGSGGNSLEFGTLRALYDHCLDTPNRAVLYMHTKGVTKGTQVATDWRKVMEYFTIDHYKECLRFLNTNDVVGINLLPQPYPHFSGNFWWANSNYIRWIDPVSFTSPYKGAMARLNCEFWVAGPPARAKSLHYTEVDHYLTAYPETEYTEIPMSDILERASRIQQETWRRASLGSARAGMAAKNP